MPNDDELIAIVAMECRLPQAADVEEFWRRLVDGDSAVTDLTDAQVAEAGVPADRRSRPDHVKRAGLLDGVAEFDSEYFGYSAREADVLDVQQRLMLEASVALLERANIDPARTGLRIGVFAGSALSTYVSGPLSRTDIVDSLGEMIIRHGNDKDFLCTRISYKLNLRGPSVTVQTACSTGLVAVHTAVQSLLLNECDAAIAGAVHIRVPQASGYHAQVGGVLSPGGVCRPFDAGADGTLFTNGLGLVLLKRLGDAIAAGDEIHAVIAGSAVNNDGAEKVSFTAPSVSGQVAVLRDALAVSGVDPADVGYIEAHGTGTALGDPIEVEAIKQAYGANGVPCELGSLKGNFGHLNIAAGIVGLIKAALVLKHRFVPATVGFRDSNPALELDGSRYFVDGGGRPLGDGVSWAGVSAFGMGGTNGHVILRDFGRERPAAAEPGDAPAILTFSAKSADGVARQAAALATHLDIGTGSLAEYAHTLRSGRTLHPFRASLAAVDRAQAVARLKAGRYHRGDPSGGGDLAFVFAGQGTQRAGMGAALAARDGTFRRRLDETTALLNEFADVDLGKFLLPDALADVTDTALAQPLLFTVEYALAMTLIEAGVEPAYVFGHSVGEIVAATVAGVFDPRTAAELVVTRGRLMARCPAGSMLAVDRLAPFEDLIADGTIVLAARNSARQFVLSGEGAAVGVAAERAVEAGIHHHRLATSHAFHSALMGDAADEFAAFLRPIRLGAPRIPLVSNVTGRVLAEYEARNPLYWAEHLLRPVDFAGSVETLRELGVSRYVEIGPGHAMSNLVRANFGPDVAPPQVAQALGEPENEAEAFADALALGWSADPAVRIAGYATAARMTAAPTYAFERRVHWIEPVTASAPAVIREAVPPREQQERKQDEQPAGIDEAMEAIRQVVTEVFEGVLGDEGLAADRGFFDLGGNSLMAIQLINRLRETFEIDLSVRDFYENSSVDASAGVITTLLLKEQENA